MTNCRVSLSESRSGNGPNADHTRAAARNLPGFAEAAAPSMARQLNGGIGCLTNVGSRSFALVPVRDPDPDLAD
jgi:hypothetical protein